MLTNTLRYAFVAAAMSFTVLFMNVSEASAQHFHGNLTHYGPVSQNIRPGCHYKVYRIHMQAGCAYNVAVNSREFDTYLYVLNNCGQIQAQNDDGGFGLNAAMTYYPRYTGIYEIFVTSFRRDATGCFDLHVHHQ